MEEDKIQEVVDKMREACRLISEAREIADTIEEHVGQYYGQEVSMSNVLERYFMYRAETPFDDYWCSSDSTC